MGRSILTSGCTRVKECIAQIICDKKTKVFLTYNHQCPALANQTFHIALCSASKCDQTINMVPTLACDQSTQCTARQSGVNDQQANVYNVHELTSLRHTVFDMQSAIRILSS